MKPKTYTMTMCHSSVFFEQSLVTYIFIISIYGMAFSGVDGNIAYE